MHVKLTSSKHLFDIWQETSYRRIADEQTLLKIHLPDVITSNRLVLPAWAHFLPAGYPKAVACAIPVRTVGTLGTQSSHSHF